FEPYKSDAPLIINSTLQAPEEGNGQVVIVERATGEKDIIVQDSTRSVKKLRDLDIETDAASAVVTFESNNKPLRVFFSDGNYLIIGKKTYNAEELRGIVEKINIDKNERTIRIKGQARKKLKDKETRIAHFNNDYHSTV